LEFNVPFSAQIRLYQRRGCFTRHGETVLFGLCSFSGDGVLMCSIDNMPAQLPRESTEYFGSLLMPHVLDIVGTPTRTHFAANYN